MRRRTHWKFRRPGPERLPEPCLSVRGKGIDPAQFNFSQDDLDYIAAHYIHLDHEQQISASAALDNRYQIRDGTGIGFGAPPYGPRRGLFLGLSKST
jgi:hypothetical protein